MATLFGMFPFLKKLFRADGGYQGISEFNQALARVLPHLKAEIVKRSNHAKGFVVCPNAGSSSALSLGSIDVEGSPRTGKTSIEKRSRSCASPQSASCSEDLVIPHEVTGQTLRIQAAHALRAVPLSSAGTARRFLSP